jgi:2OG-Fe(II) oxygenase superfamily
MNSPVDHGEGLQVIRYRIGARVTPHFDFLMPSHGDNEHSLRRSGQRISTLIVYLNDVERGGETVFPEVGATVCALRGQAIYFEYCNSANQLDPLSVHAGAPVLTGEKWALTKWMRQRRFVHGSGSRRKCCCRGLGCHGRDIADVADRKSSTGSASCFGSGQRSGQALAVREDVREIENLAGVRCTAGHAG